MKCSRMDTNLMFYTVLKKHELVNQNYGKNIVSGRNLLDKDIRVNKTEFKKDTPVTL